MLSQCWSCIIMVSNWIHKKKKQKIIINTQVYTTRESAKRALCCRLKFCSYFYFLDYIKEFLGLWKTQKRGPIVFIVFGLITVMRLYSLSLATTHWHFLRSNIASPIEWTLGIVSPEQILGYVCLTLLITALRIGLGSVMVWKFYKEIKSIRHEWTLSYMEILYHHFECHHLSFDVILDDRKMIYYIFMYQYLMSHLEIIK